ncbi:hypothetical protein HYW76_02655 [Candidatus Pacearchaeota archaeon]|nr:hypothetical protein [Candidatus Pacearchaeota archaeon]
MICMKRVMGIAFLVAGIAITLASSSITAAVIGINKAEVYFFGLSLIALGIVLLLVSQTLEEIAQSPVRVKKEKVRIMISRPALERARKDGYIKNHLSKYKGFIRKIAANPINPVKENIGDFSISPLGAPNERVAWHYDARTNTLYIDDVLYHDSDRRYVDNWNKKVTSRKVTKSQYQQSGYVKYDEKGDIKYYQSRKRSKH